MIEFSALSVAVPLSLDAAGWLVAPRRPPRRPELPLPELAAATPYRQVRAAYTPFEDDLKPARDDDGFDRLRFLAALKAYLDRRGLSMDDWEAPKTAPAESLVNGLAMMLPFDSAEKQALLEAASLSERREALIALMEIDAMADPRDDEPPAMQ